MKRTLVALAVALAAAGCGSSSGLPDYRPQDYPPVETVILERGFALGSGASAAMEFQMPLTGHLIATVDWTHASNNVVATFSSQRCADVNLALAGACAENVYQAKASTCPAKPRVVTAYAISGSPVRLYVANAGVTAESGRVRLVLCSDAPDCGQGLACAQCLTRVLDQDSCRTS